MIRAELLGPIRITIDGAPAPPAFLWRKNLAVCLLLWHARERRLSRARLIDLLWGERGDAEARHSLNEALRVLRRHAGADALQTDGDHVAWVGDVTSDTTEFLERVTADPVAAASLVRGEWCEGYALRDAADADAWLEDERREWRRRAATALQRAAATMEEQGDLSDALALVRRARALEPLDEASARLHCRVLALGGDRHAALAEAREFTEALQERLGLSPDGATRKLVRAIADGDVALRPPTRDPEASAVAIPLVGRAGLLRELVATMRTARGPSRSTLVLLEGEAGSGRTRLLEELALRAAADGCSLVVVRAVPEDSALEESGLRAIANSALARAAGVTAAAPAAIAALAAWAPSWAERFPGSADGAPDRLGTREALVAVLRAAAGERPVVLCLDDVDAMDRQTIAAIPTILRALEDLPLGIVATTSPSPDVDLLARHLDRPDRGAMWRLAPLELAELEQAIGAVLPGWDAAARERLARRLLHESGGLPAVAFGILAAVRSGLSLEEAPWPVPDRTYDATLPARLPGTLTASVRLRFRQLDRLEGDLLLAIALSAGPVDPARLAVVLAAEADVVAIALDRLEAGRWVVLEDRGFQFRARAIGGLLRDEMLTPGARRRLAARLAEVGP